MTTLTYDLHIHSCLSPCADNDMTPANIAGMAHVKELDIIALCDHNSVRNAPALIEAAKPFDLIVLPGMELTTAEEIHVLCLFASLDAALDFDRYVYSRLIKVENRIAYFGEQLLMNEADEVTGFEKYLLTNATSITFDESADLVRSFGGLMIPAHLEKQTTSLLSVLGTIPPDASFITAEINHEDRCDELLSAHPYLTNCRLIHDSDAHSLGHIAEPDHTLSFSCARPAPQDVLDLLSSSSGLLDL